jgi:hypothetical protein
MNLSEIQRLIDSEWQLETQLDSLELPGAIRAALSAEDEFPPIEFNAVVPGKRPTFAFVVNSLDAIEKRLRLAIIFTFMEPGRPARFGELDALLNEFRNLPINVTALALSSTEIQVEIDGKVIKVIQVDPSPKPSWRKKLVQALLLIFAGSSMTFVATNYVSKTPVTLPTTQEINQKIDDVCGVLPDGTEITIKSGVIEAKMKCGGTDSQVSHQE